MLGLAGFSGVVRFFSLSPTSLLVMFEMKAWVFVWLVIVLI